MIEKSLSTSGIKKTKTALGEEAFQEYLTYCAKFMDLSGPYASSNRKYVLAKVTPAQATKVVEMFAPTLPKSDRAEIVKLLTDTGFEPQRYPEDPNGKGLELTGGNLYEKGITGEEVKAVLDKPLKTTLNCRVIKTEKGLACEIQTTKTKGFVGAKLRKIVSALEKAKEYSKSALQKEQIDATIRYFHTGDIQDFRKANIAWVKDGASSPIDLMIGWVEVYEDFLARIGSWEAYVQVLDPEVSKLSQTLAKHAQHFENAMPYGEFKKVFPKDYSPPALMVYYFQELASYRTGGYNLPNFDDIRRDVGAKNVIRLPMPGEAADPAMKEMWMEVYNEFLVAGKAEEAFAAREKTYRILVLLHEIIGHGSGTYDVTKYDKDQDPISGLGSYGSALEEQRADLTALVFAADPKLVEIGYYKDEAEAKATLHQMYDYYLTDFLRRTSGQRSFSEAHQRGHWLFVNRLLKEKAIKWVAKDLKSPMTLENQVLVVEDYEDYHKVSVDLLQELQRIKAVRDEVALKNLFEKEAPLSAIEEPWAQAIIKRGANLLINAGYVEQPWRVTSDLKYETFGEISLEKIAPYFGKMNP